MRLGGGLLGREAVIELGMRKRKIRITFMVPTGKDESKKCDTRKGGILMLARTTYRGRKKGENYSY